MLNRYTQLPKATIAQTQVLPDIGILDSALQRQQESYDTTAREIQSAKQVASSLQGYGEKDKEYLAKLNQDMTSFVGTISNKDLGSQEVKKQWNDYLMTAASDPELKKIQKVNQLKADWDKQSQELAAKGKLYGSQAKLHQQAWEAYSQTGDTRYLPTESLYEAQDLIEGRSKLVNMIKASGSSGTKFLNDIAYKTSSKGVSIDKLDKAVQAQLDTYARSQYGKQEFDDFTVAKQEGSIPKDMKFGDYLIKQIKSTTDNFVHMDYDSDYSSAWNKHEERAYQKKKEDEYAGEGYTPAMNTSVKAEIDSDGRINLPWYSDAWDAMTGGDSRTPEQLELEKTLKLSKDKAGFKGSLKEYTEQVINTDPNIKVRYYSAEKANKISTQFFNPKTQGGTYMNTRAWDEESGKWMSFSDYMKEHNITQEEAKEGFTIIGDISPDNPLTPRGMQAVVAGKSVILDNSSSRASSTEQGIRDEFIHEAAKARYNGKGEHTFEFQEPSNKQWYKVTSTLNERGELNDPVFSLIQK